ncbi:O-acetyltransferase OatA [Caulifigura coniformis]|uniref:O-acetyltransferase OatA n=1 Tax=Caulifigura coniformis TaxID=2527983 RepID=A0A517SJ70_9PLAN|nr:acyltransferase [Caulifigura coniformis]QDT56167.1 O-acetyltransferase OatA [Caulifigura coniformis]
MNLPTMWTLETREYSSAPSDHRRALDGIRGIAILTVFLYDCLKLPPGGPISFVVRKASAAGWVGVDLFFVLSGFLITGILLDSRGKPGYLSSFFARRSLRIFPLYFLSLWITFVLLPQLAEFLPSAGPISERIGLLSTHQVWFWTYLQNWWMAFEGHWPDVNYLNHFWSLAVEEQFYLVWPFLVGWLSLRGLTRLCWACVIGALALRIGLWISGAPSVVMYVTTVTRMDSLALGGLFAIGLRSPVWYARLSRIAVPGMIGLAGLIVGLDAVWPVLKTQTAGAQTIGHTLLGFLFGMLVFSAAAMKPDHLAARLLSQRWLTLPGQFSYAMYVMHRPVHKLVTRADWAVVPSAIQPLAVFVATLALSLVCAALSWKFFERPFLSLKAWFPRPGEKRPASETPGEPAVQAAAATC